MIFGHQTGLLSTQIDLPLLIGARLSLKHISKAPAKALLPIY